MENVKNVLDKTFCHDCKKELKIKDDEIKGGVLLKYRKGDEEIMAYKCNGCFKKDASLSNHQKCEVYSRIVGYLRPVQQWNEGKKKEFVNRTEYKTDKKSCQGGCCNRGCC